MICYLFVFNFCCIVTGSSFFDPVAPASYTTFDKRVTNYVFCFPVRYNILLLLLLCYLCIVSCIIMKESYISYHSTAD